jgi:rhodanese-related sulfurtransferase
MIFPTFEVIEYTLKLIKMMDFLKNIFKSAPEVDYAALLKEGGVILDVRTAGEYAGGHIKGSTNIAVDAIPHSLKKLRDKSQPIITCCASGMRSSSAKKMLKAAGYTNVHNGGSWMELRGKLTAV